MKDVINDNTESYEEVVAGALANKVNYLVEQTSAGKIQLAETGLAIGAIKSQMSPSDIFRPVRLLGKNGTVKMIQSAAITVGARVILDTANPGKVKALPTGTPGSYRSLGVKQSAAEYGTAAGAGGDVIEVLDVIETVHVVTAFSGATPAATAATNSSPYGFTGAAQADALVTNVREMRAALIALGFMS